MGDIILLNQAEIKGQLKELVRGTVEETLNKLQQLVGARHKPPHNHFENLFRGLLYCLHCGCRLSMLSPLKNGKRYHKYRCNQHSLHPDKCPKPHEITFGNIYSVVLVRVQGLAKLMREDDALIKLIQQKSARTARTDKLIAEKSKTEKRMNELSRLLRKLFEDNAKGLVDDRNYEVMIGEYQAEQASLSGKMVEIKKQLAEKVDYAGQLEKLRDAVRDCLDIKELTPFVLNKLIDRIEVGSQEVVDGQRQQEIRIVWRFAGEIQ